MLRSSGRRPRVTVGSIAFDRVTASEAASTVRDGLARGSGGLVVVAGRELHDRGLPPPLQEAALVLAGSSSTVWASRLAGRPLPHRTRPAALAEALCAAAAVDGHRVFLVGGAPGGPGVPSGAQRAAAVLGLRFRGLSVAATASVPTGHTPTAQPPTGHTPTGHTPTGHTPTGHTPTGHAPTGHAPTGQTPDAETQDGWAALCADVVAAKAELVLVGADTASQERILAELRAELPGAWLFASTGLIDAIVAGAGARRSAVADARS